LEKDVKYMKAAKSTRTSEGNSGLSIGKGKGTFSGEGLWVKNSLAGIYNSWERETGRDNSPEHRWRKNSETGGSGIKRVFLLE